MQHTEEYGFNLIEMKDTFSTEALNDNTRKIEEAMKKKGNCIVVESSFVGDGVVPREIELGFSPKLVFVSGNSLSTIVGRGFFYSSYSLSKYVTLTDTGFRLTDVTHNFKDKTMTFVAFG